MGEGILFRHSVLSACMLIIIDLGYCTMVSSSVKCKDEDAAHFPLVTLVTDIALLGIVTRLTLGA